MGTKKADSCAIQKSAFNKLATFFVLSLTLGPLYFIVIAAVSFLFTSILAE